MSWCIDCGESFRYDDCGGYNPPCKCGAHCRDCHDAEEREGKYLDDDWCCPECGGSDCDCGGPESEATFGERPHDSTETKNG